MRAELIIPQMIVIEDMTDTIDELDGIMPVFIRPVRIIPGEDRPDYWLCEIDPPLLWGADGETMINKVLMVADGQEPLLKPIYKTRARIAYVTDESLAQDARLDDTKFHMAGTVICSDNVEYWRMKAREGDAEAQYQFGLLFETGQGVGQAMSIALKWLRRAAEQGHTGAREKVETIESSRG